MRSLVLLLVFAAAVGCAKKKPAVDTPDVAVAPQPTGPGTVKPDDQGKPKGDTPGSPNHPRFTQTDSVGNIAPAPHDAGKATPDKPASGIEPPGAKTPGPVNPDPPAAPVPRPQPPRGGMKTPAAPKPVAAPDTPRRPVTMDQMRDIGTFIDAASGASGTMPGPDVVYAALVKAESPAAAGVKDGSIALTGTRNRESVWAFETAALKQGGLAVGPNGVERLTAAELTQRLMGR